MCTHSLFGLESRRVKVFCLKLTLPFPNIVVGASVGQVRYCKRLHRTFQNIDVWSGRVFSEMINVFWMFNQKCA